MLHRALESLRGKGPHHILWLEESNIAMAFGILRCRDRRQPHGRDGQARERPPTATAAKPGSETSGDEGSCVHQFGLTRLALNRHKRPLPRAQLGAKTSTKTALRRATIRTVIGRCLARERTSKA